MMRKLMMLFIALLPLGIYAQGGANTIVFDLIYKGDVIGTLTAVKSMENGGEVYKVATDVRKKVLNVKTVLYNVTANYMKGQLTGSDYKLYVNEKLDKSAAVETKDGQLYGSKKGKKQKKIKFGVTYSAAKFYFEEPAGVSEVFSESKLTRRKLQPHSSKANTYVLDKNKGEYVYENGELQKIIYEDVVKVQLVRK